MKAAILTAQNTPLEIADDVELAAPQKGEVRVRIAASGVCHSDVSCQNGTIPMMPPAVLGHEGAGIVEEVGEGVTRVQPGDHVVLTFVPQCRECFYCKRDQGYACDEYSKVGGGGLLDGTRRLTRGTTQLGQMSFLGTFAEAAVVPEICLVKIDKDIPLKAAALIGCGVQTGVGAALNTANIRKGDAVAVIGCGGVGLNVIQGARIAGADKIIAVDLMQSKLDMAKEFGATDFVNAGEGNAIAEVQRLTNERGADVVFEVIGLGPTIDQAINMTRKAGECVLVGVPRLDVMMNLNAAFTFLYGVKTIKGCWYGSTNADKDVPKLLDLYKKGELKLDELISREIKLEDVNEAFDAMQAGEVARSVIVNE